MALSLKNLSKNSQAALQAIGLFLLITIGILLIIFFTPAVEGTQKVQSGFYSFSQTISSWTADTFFDRETLRGEHKYYQDLASLHTHEEAYINELEQSVAQLEAALKYEETIGYTTTIARVLSRSINKERELLIDKGILDGIIVGQAVVVGDGHLVGEIIDLNDRTATVRLLQDKDSSIAAAILGSDKTIGLIEGREGYLLSMQFIPQDERIDVHDVAVTSGLDELIPSGLVIGVVSELITNDAAAFQEARIEQIIQENDFSYVTVMQIPL
ncbi:rod shape-determining protein MreC [Candidatus Uhrbacteria bacterium]|jgi:rod shape-determining protein MreC|nr:rod shape-determining protein MreC [Candidatus Uhrbacteria bacterium]